MRLRDDLGRYQTEERENVAFTRANQSCTVQYVRRFMRFSPAVLLLVGAVCIGTTPRSTAAQSPAPQPAYTQQQDAATATIPTDPPAPHPAAGRPTPTHPPRPARALGSSDRAPPRQRARLHRKRPGTPPRRSE